MTISKNHEIFIKDFTEAIELGNAAVFAGAGLSVGAGYVDWKELLNDIADGLSLDINRQDDLISLAQYHYNENKSRSILNQKILNFFTEETEQTENHKILSRLPISTYWTTNYDGLIEKSLESLQKIVDVKHQNTQLPNSKFKRDAVVYKMHGDANHANEAIITRDDYERYFKTHEPFITALQGDLTTKTFLFIGFSFRDPNLDYVLSRIRLNFKDNAKRHFCILKRVRSEDYKHPADFDFYRRKQELQINDLKNYQIASVLVDDYSEIPSLLGAIEDRYKRKSIFISGSAVEYGNWGRERAGKFIHKLTERLIKKKYRVVNGFGLGIGSAVINGGLQTIYSNTQKYSENQLITRPFPQFMTSEIQKQTAWQEYRERMISLTGISIYIFGNKEVNSKIQLAEGMRKEFVIAKKIGSLPIPVVNTGYMAQEIWDLVMENINEYYKDPVIIALLKDLKDETETDKIISKILNIVEAIIENS